MARPAKIWQRKDRPGWWATIDGRKVLLGETRADAERAFYAARIASGGASPPTGPAFRELVDRFLLHVRANRKAATLDVYTRFLTAFGRVRYGAKTIGYVLAADLRPFHLSAAFEKNPQWSAAVRRQVMVQTVTVLNWSVRQGFLAANPLAGKLDLPPARSRGRDSVWTDADFAIVLAHARPRFREFLTALRLTGCRPGEVATVRAAHVDLARGLWVLPEHKTDADGLPRVVHLSPAMVALTGELVERAGGEGLLFLSERGRPWNPVALDGAMSKVRKRIRAAGGKLTGKGILYGLRHTFATELLSAGVPDAHVAALLGHKGTAMLHRHYNHLTGNAAVLRSHLAHVKGPQSGTGTPPPALPGAA